MDRLNAKEYKDTARSAHPNTSDTLNINMTNTLNV